MTGWYSITATGPIAIGNLTPIGQNSGQVGCRFPPNGHHLAACVNLPSHCQLWGPFWYYSRSLYLILPNPVYTTDIDRDQDTLPNNFYRLQWQNNRWIVQDQHLEAYLNEDIEIIGSQYLIKASFLKEFWNVGGIEIENTDEDAHPLQPFPWQTLVLSHNSREDFQVKDEGGFFAEMATLINPSWSIAIKIIGNYDDERPGDYERSKPPKWGSLGAGNVPVVINPIPKQRSESWEWLGDSIDSSTGGILLTGALWQLGKQKISVPFPNDVSFSNNLVKTYAAEMAIPWQSWKKTKNPLKSNQSVKKLIPGEWLTPAGAVYLWNDPSIFNQSGPLLDPYNRHVLGYGHLWLFKDEDKS